MNNGCMKQLIEDVRQHNEKIDDAMNREREREGLYDANFCDFIGKKEEVQRTYRIVIKL